ncbi:MAG: hypothetical protein C0596_17675 [Marinilabiliales bacterium]|nr:MAG: hypothetical protein C0596_17675 [Marinilabiliales bacterium]
MNFNPYAIPVYVVFIIMLFFLLFSIKNHRGKHMYFFILFNLASSVYIIFYGLEISTDNFEFMKVFYQLEYIGIPYVPVFFFLFVLKFSGKNKFFKSKVYYLIYLIPFLITVSVLTNPLHNLYIKEFDVNESFFTTLILNKGIIYWIQQVYSFLCFLLGILILVRLAIKTESNKSYIILSIASGLPFVLYIFYIAGLITYNLDPIPFSFLFSSLLIFFSLSVREVLLSSDIISAALFENIDSGLIVIDDRNILRDINDKAKDIICITDSDIGSISDDVLPFKLNNSSINYNFVFNDPKRNKIYDISTVKLKYLFKDGLGVLVLISDVTENKNIEKALLEKEENYMDIVDNATDLIQSVDIEGNILFANKAWLDTLGYSEDNLRKIKIWDIIAEDDILHCQEVFKDLQNGECENNIRTVFISKTGKKVYVEGNINCRTVNGKFVGTRGIFRDITEIVSNEEKLSNQLKHQKLISEITSDFIDPEIDTLPELLNKTARLCGMALKVDRVIINIFDKSSDIFNDLYQYNSPESNLGISNFKDFNKQSFPWWKEQINKNHYVLIKDIDNLPVNASIEKKIYKEQGIKSLLSFSLRNKSKVLGFIGFDSLNKYRSWTDEEIHTLQVISEIISKTIVKVRIEESLRKTKEQFQLAINGSNDGIWDWDLGSNTLFLSDKWKTMLGYEPSEIENNIDSYFQIIHPDDASRVNKYLKKYLVGKFTSYNIDFRAKQKNGEYVWIRAKGEGIRDDEGNIVRMAGSHTDISHEVEERELLLEMMRNTEILIKCEEEEFYDIIAESIRKVSGASYCGFNLYINDEFNAQTVSLVGFNERIDEACNAIGIKLKGKIWSRNTELEEGFKNGNLVIKERLFEFKNLNSIQKPLKYLINKFNIGNTVIIKVSNEQKLLGYFTLIFNKNTQLKNRELIELYSYYVSLYLERKELNTKLKESVENAQKANAAKSEFLAHMSHEIRTPLNGVIGFSNLLMQTELNEKQKKFTDTINVSANILLALINDILDFSKIEAGKLELNYEFIDLKKLISNIFEIVKLPCEEKDLEISFNYDDNIPSIVYTDELSIRQILLNILSNAIKFTERGRIQIDISTTKCGADDEGNFIYNFSIKDTGIGIPKEIQSKILDSFTQADASITKKYGGSGLGLSIANSLLQKMGSKLEFSSNSGRGSHFFFNICFNTKQIIKEEIIKQEEFKDIALDATTKERKVKNGQIKVLVVEDSETNILLFKHILYSILPDCEIIEAEDGTKGLDNYKIYNPDLIFMDIHMPEMSGYDVAKEIRKTDNFTPIIAISAGTLSEEREKSHNVGMNEYLTKPVSYDKIKQVLKTYLNSVNENE